jgi:hypothetical protein
MYFASVYIRGTLVYFHNEKAYIYFWRIFLYLKHTNTRVENITTRNWISSGFFIFLRRLKD